VRGGLRRFSTAHSNGTNKVIDTQGTFLLSSPVYIESHPLRSTIFVSRIGLRDVAFASRMNLGDAVPAATGYSICKLVTPTPTDPTGTLYPFSFQSLAEPYSPSCSNGTPFIPFNFILLQTLSFPTGGIPTPPLSIRLRSPIFSQRLCVSVAIFVKNRGEGQLSC
jgi:hypothetical protein